MENSSGHASVTLKEHQNPGPWNRVHPRQHRSLEITPPAEELHRELLSSPKLFRLYVFEIGSWKEKMVCKPHLVELENIWSADGFVQPPSNVLYFCLSACVEGAVLLEEKGVYWLIELFKTFQICTEHKSSVCVCVCEIKTASHACGLFHSTQRVGVVSIRPSWFAVLVQWRFSVYKVIRVLRVPPRLTEVRLIYVSISGAPL